MDISTLYKQIASVTTRFEFTDPVDDADLCALHDHLVEATRDIPRAEIRVERDPDPRYVLVELESPVGGYGRQMIIRKVRPD